MCFPFNKFCFCISLEVGTQVISILSTMVTASISLLYGSTVALVLLPYLKMVFYAIVAVVFGLHSLCGCFMIYAAFGNQPRYIWPWLIVSWCESVVLISLSVLGAALQIYTRGIYEYADLNLMIAIYFVYALVLVYFASVANSRRVQMVSEQVQTKGKARLLRPTTTAWKYV